MNDQDLRQDTIATLVALLAIAITATVLTSAWWQKWQFINDCEERHPTEMCAEIWRNANG